MNQNVRFDGAIANSPKIKSSSQSVSNANEIPAATDIPNFKRKANTYNKATGSHSAYDYSVVTKTVETSNSSPAMGGGLAIVGGRGGANSADNVYSNNLSQPFSEQNIGSSQLQRAPATPSGDPHDPGGDPVGNPLPVGDGISVLIAFALLYTIYIYKKRLTVS